MINTTTPQKLKIQLSDFDYQRDITNRLLIDQFTSLDLEVLEEILYSPLHVSIKKLADYLDLSVEQLMPTLEKLSHTELFKIEDLSLEVDKEMRKYFEFQIIKFDNDFKPDMSFLQVLLKKVPIEVLPIWYAIPRTSNNIFDSIIEKYLCTPQMYQRHLFEVKSSHPLFEPIIEDVFTSASFKVPAKKLREKYNLSKEEFAEILLLLELNFVLCLSYSKIDQDWEEVVTPFYEWKKYLEFIKDTELSSISKPKLIQKKGSLPFAFTHAMAALLQKGKKAPFFIKSAEIESMGHALFDFSKEDMQQVMEKACMLKLAEIEDEQFSTLPSADEFLHFGEKNRAVYLHKHHLNHPLSLNEEESMCLKKHIHEAEKTLSRTIDKEWVTYEEFVKGVINPFSDEDRLVLKKDGKNWGYHMPLIEEKDHKLLKALIFEALFEASMVDIGYYNDKECFCLTEFGKSFFEE